MRYRRLSPTGDYVINRPFLVNSPACVAQAIQTRLNLWKRQWFLDLTDGTAYLDTPGVLGKQLQGAADLAIRQRIAQTPGVKAITSYASVAVPGTRALTVSAQVDTIFGPATIAGVTIQTAASA